jgi:hypothetical protein
LLYKLLRCGGRSHLQQLQQAQYVWWDRGSHKEVVETAVPYLQRKSCHISVYVKKEGLAARKWRPENPGEWTPRILFPFNDFPPSWSHC